MAILKPVFIQPASGDVSELDYSGSELRQLVQALAGQGVRGIIAPPARVVSHRAAGADWSVDIAAFQAIVDGGDVTDQGSYLVTNTAVYNFPTGQTPQSTSRTHRLVAQVRDHRASATWAAGTYDWAPMLLADTGSGEPALPASAITLAHITIAPGQPNIADSNIGLPYTVLRNLVPQGPWSSAQAGVGGWNAANTWTSYTGGQWPAVTITVPPSGKVYITISASVRAHNANTAVGWRISGTDTVNNDTSHAVRSGASDASGSVGYLARASARTLVTGLTPGGSDTVTPTWFTATTGDGSTDDGDGQLIVEAAG